ncbi:MAG: DNA-binding protein [Eubacteriales bacterium]|nr:DNA-binding protein [Eubacteriales bacterium]
MELVFRLRRGDDLLAEIRRRAAALPAGYVACCVGCVSRARIRDASGVTIRELSEPLEIVSLTGTVSAARCHLHISLSREDLSTVGGHLCEGCIVNTTAEIVLRELPDCRFGAEQDAQTGYDELTVSPR